jgi:MFS family permease
MSVGRAPQKAATIWNKNFICVVISNLMLCFAHFSINPLVASYMKYLGAGAQLTGFLAGMFFAVAFLMHPFAGPAMTKIDKRKLLVFVFAIGSIASFGYALFPNIPAFIVFRFLSGVQYSMVGGLIMTLAADHLPEERLAYGLGIYGIGGAFGTALAPAIGIGLLDYGTQVKGEGFGFTLAFLFAAVTLALAIIPALVLDPDRKTKEEVASTGAWYKNIFTIHALSSTILIFLVQIPFSMLNTYMVEFGKTQGIAGISVFFTVFAVVLAGTRPMSGFLTDRFGVNKVMYPALALFAASLVLVGVSSSLTTILIAAICAAVGFGSSQPSIQAMSMKVEPPLRRGVASNTIYMGFDLGLFAGPFIGGFIYEKHGYPTMFITGAVPIVIAMICFAVTLPGYFRRIRQLESPEK